MVQQNRTQHIILNMVNLLGSGDLAAIIIFDQSGNTGSQVRVNR